MQVGPSSLKYSVNTGSFCSVSFETRLRIAFQKKGPDPVSPEFIQLINIGNDSPGYNLAVALPILAVLLAAFLLVSAFTVHEKHAEIDDVEIREDHAPGAGGALLELGGDVTGDGVLVAVDEIPGHACGQAVAEGHDPVAEVVDVAGTSPPAGDDEFGSSFGGDGLEVGDARVVGVRPEAVLLVVGGAEDVVSHALEGEDAGDALQPEGERVDGQVAGLKAVEGREPGNVAEGKHEAESVVDAVDRGQDSGFHVQAVEDVEHLESGDHDDGVGYIAVDFVLVGDECEVKNDVPYQTRTHLVEEFDVDGLASCNGDEGGNGDTRVHLAADEEVVDDVA